MNENKLTKRIEELFADGQITLAIGYEMGTSGPRPFFCRSAQDASRMVFSNDFPNNLAVYLTKKEVVAGEKVAVAATVSALRSIAYLFRENQVGQNQFTILHLSPNDELMHFRTPSDIDVYIDHIPSEPSERDREILEKLEAMTPAERWQFWQAEFSKCIKCYACRAACPMCYCTRCIVDDNRPQWIDPWRDAPGRALYRLRSLWRRMSGRHTGASSQQAPAGKYTCRFRYSGRGIPQGWCGTQYFPSGRP